MSAARLHKVVSALPGALEANSLYLVRVGTGFTLMATNSSGGVNAYPLNGVLPGGGELGQVLQKLSSSDFDVEWATPAQPGGSFSRVQLASDVTNNNATANTLADVTGLQFPVTAGKKYWFRFRIVYSAAATTTGSRWAINGPATTQLAYRSSYSLTASSRSFNEAVTAYNLPAASNASSAAIAAANVAEIEGVLTATASGNVIARFASEVANSAIIAKAGISFVEYQELP